METCLSYLSCRYLAQINTCPGETAQKKRKKSALLCKPGRADLLAGAIQKLIDDPELAGRLVAAGRRDVKERFDISRTIAATQGLYESLLKERPTDQGS